MNIPVTFSTFLLGCVGFFSTRQDEELFNEVGGFSSSDTGFRVNAKATMFS